METGLPLDVWREGLLTAAAVAAPFLVAALAVGLMTALIQAATQMQDNVLSLVPKLVAVGLVLAIAGSWLLDRTTRYTERSFTTIVEISHEGRQWSK